MTYTPEHLKLWTLPDHYSGAHWPDYYVGLGQHRDSDTLTRSNFECFLKLLGGESDTVHVVREGHWAVGWIEWIAIHKDDHEALAKADSTMAALEDYPVVNEDHWSELEYMEAQEVWRDCYRPKDRIEYIRRNRSQFEFHDFKDMLGVVRGHYFNGYAGELLT